MPTRIIVLILYCMVHACNTYGRVLNPTISLSGTYTSTRNFTGIESGKFAIENRKINFGIEAGNKFYFSDNWFVSAGVRYNQFKTTINSLNQIPVLMDHPDPFTWERRFESLAVPLSIGREFNIQDRTGHLFIGGSLGILMTSYARNSSTIALKKDPDNTDLIVTQSLDSGFATPSFFYPTLDIGGSYRPFRNLQQLSIGFLCTVQLNKTDEYYYQGTTQNFSRGEEFNYRMGHAQRFINFSLMLSYTFGKVRSMSDKHRNTDCPKQH